MNRCSYCQKQVIRNLKISEILGLGKILPQICEDCSNLFRPINKQQSCRTCQKELPGDIRIVKIVSPGKTPIPIMISVIMLVFTMIQPSKNG